MKYILLLLVLLSSCDMITDARFYDKFDKTELYYDDYSEIGNYSDIALWMRARVKGIEDAEDDWSTPKETMDRGCGDCEDWSWLFINIAYVRFGIKMDIVIVHTDNRAIIDGGDINHAIVQYNGKLYEPQHGEEVEYSKIGYRYTFDELFKEN